MGTLRGSGLLVLLVVAAAAAGSARAAPAPARPATPPRRPGPPPQGNEVARTATGGGESWGNARLDALERAGIIRGDVALSILAQWAFETDSGRAEWNNNVGNLKASASQPRIDLGAAGMFRAFATLDDGVQAYLALVQSGRFTPCWGLLQADPRAEDWVRCLGRLGYYEASPDTYAAGWSSRRAELAKRFRFEVQGSNLFGFLAAIRRP